MKQFTIIFQTFLFLCLWSMPLQAGQLYKCENGGQLTFQDKPCPEAKQEIGCSDKQGQIKYQDKPCEQEPFPTSFYQDSESNGSNINYPYAASSRGASSYGAGGSRNKPGTDIRVRGYTRKDGTHVNSYTRSRPGGKT